MSVSMKAPILVNVYCQYIGQCLLPVKTKQASFIVSSGRTSSVNGRYMAYSIKSQSSY